MPIEGRLAGIDDAAAVVDGHVVGLDAGDLEHGDEQRGLVFAVAVAVAKDVGGMIGLKSADAALDDEVANVFLDRIGDAAELGVEVGSAGDEGLHVCAVISGEGSVRSASRVVNHWPMARH